MQTYNPMQLINGFWPGADTQHIKYDPDMKKGQYFIITGSTHDGTLAFTYQSLQKMLARLLNMQTHYKPETPESWTTVKQINYTVGPIKHASKYGMVKLGIGDGRYPGIHERFKMPVTCELVLK